MISENFLGIPLANRCGNNYVLKEAQNIINIPFFGTCIIFVFNKLFLIFSPCCGCEEVIWRHLGKSEVIMTNLLIIRKKLKFAASVV